jgi:ribosomal protein S18 acetylase RimI-like enzyme
MKVIAAPAQQCNRDQRSKKCANRVKRTMQAKHFSTMFRRRGIGEQLGSAAIAFAHETGARSVFLLTNSSLSGAIRLYERLGFRHAPDPDPPEYARADVYMELPIGHSGS